MSEAGSVPFTETKSPESPERLHKGALGLVDIAASTMANIGPAYSFYFGFAGIVIMAPWRSAPPPFHRGRVHSLPSRRRANRRRRGYATRGLP